ncbi:MAG: hypothetical protein KatS3mg112_0513 [Thermogutta sp.]|nr:MAG: hypothetical protein KatS3mg112_0513 [Thermogutta sp.]
MNILLSTRRTPAFQTPVRDSPRRSSGNCHPVAYTHPSNFPDPFSGLSWNWGHLWLARVELENALEAAARAAVKAWGLMPVAVSTYIPRQIGVCLRGCQSCSGGFL